MAVTRKNNIIILKANGDNVPQTEALFIQKITFRETANSTADVEIQVNNGWQSLIDLPAMTAHQFIQVDFPEGVQVNGLKEVLASGAVEVRVYIY